MLYGNVLMQITSQRMWLMEAILESNWGHGSPKNMLNFNPLCVHRRHTCLVGSFPWLLCFELAASLTCFERKAESLGNTSIQMAHKETVMLKISDI